MSESGFILESPVEKVPMHPEDYGALLEWVRAKEQWDPSSSSEG
jgi:hypothetical protein